MIEGPRVPACALPAVLRAVHCVIIAHVGCSTQLVYRSGDTRLLLKAIFFDFRPLTFDF